MFTKMYTNDLYLQKVGDLPEGLIGIIGSPTRILHNEETRTTLFAQSVSGRAVEIDIRRPEFISAIAKLANSGTNKTVLVKGVEFWYHRESSLNRAKRSVGRIFHK